MPKLPNPTERATLDPQGTAASRIALALPVEVMVLFVGAAAVLEWLRG